MTRRMRWTWLCAAWLALSLACGLGSSSPAITGRWQSTEESSVEMEFRANGLFELSTDGRTFSGSYDWVDSDNIEVSIEGDLGTRTMYLTEIQIDQDQLTVDIDGRTTSFVRVDDD